MCTFLILVIFYHFFLLIPLFRKRSFFYKVCIVKIDRNKNKKEHFRIEFSCQSEPLLAASSSQDGQSLFEKRIFLQTLLTSLVHTINPKHNNSTLKET